MRAMNTYVLLVTTHFWQSETSCMELSSNAGFGDHKMTVKKNCNRGMR